VTESSIEAHFLRKEIEAMAAIKVTPDQLLNVSGQLSAGANSIESTLSQLASQVAPLGSDWAGVAQTRFEALWQEWQKSAAGIHEALTGVAQLTKQAGESFAESDQAIAGTFNAS
jgi:WXG100 family type VII secretion target